MRALASNGRRVEALAQYEACCRTLDEELGVPPARETVALYEAICDAQDLTGLSNLSGLGTLPPHNLPAPATPFVGREGLLDGLRGLLQEPDCRLVTLVGPGGSGKTRLALEAAARELVHYPHGVFFVPLAPLSSVDAIVPAVAQALGLSLAGGDPRRQLLYYLRHKQILLVIDNLEHLLTSPGEEKGRGGGGSEILLEVLRAAPEIQMLVTSRMQLGASSEHVLTVPGMDVPPVSGKNAFQYSGLQLYLQQARCVRPNYDPGDEALAGIVRICRLVEGMPLAILLAAAWMDVLPPDEIGAELEKSIAFLHSDLSDLPQRHRSMVATFDVSWNLLSEVERDAFAALSVFRGSCTREAAQAVARADVAILRSLVRKCFLTRDEDGRYQVHELLRQYGEDKLRHEPQAWERARDRHCTYYAGYLAGREDAFRKLGPGEARLEIDNIRAAWRWMLDRGKVAECRQAIGGFYWFDEGWPWWNALRPLLEGAVALLRRAEPSRENRIALGIALCYHSDTLGYSEEAERAPALAREGHRILTELDARRELAQAKIFAYLVGMAEDDAHADRLLQEGLSLARETGRPTVEAYALHIIALRCFMRAMVDGRPEGEMFGRAQEAYARALAICRRTGNRLGEAGVLTGQALCAHAEGRYAEARSLHQESLALYRELGAQWRILYSIRKLGDLALTAGAYQEARAHYQAYLDESQARGLPIETRYALCGLGDVVLATEAPRKAAELYRRAVQEAIEGWVFSGIERIMLSMAKRSAQGKEFARAAELLALAYHILATYAPYHWETVGLAGGKELERELQAHLTPEVLAAAQERGRARDMGETLHELLAELEADLSAEAEERSG
jgi:predicted ATPase